MGTSLRKPIRIRVCGACYQALHPTEYEPVTYNYGECNMCGFMGFVHRANKKEIEEWKAGNLSSHQ